MVGVSILPVAIHNGKLFFLFGKEKSVEYGIQGFSDFGGGRENESTFDGAIREGCEEMTGFYGNEHQLRAKIKKAGGTYQINHDDKYYYHIFLTDYDENLPYYFGNNHHYLYEKMNNGVLKETKLFEKIELKWFSPSDMKRRIHVFRPFYREIVKQILKDLPNISKFLKSKKRKNKTLKNKK